MSDNNAVVRTSRLTKVYGEGESPVTALDNVDVSFQRGEFTAIMGPAGAGKSTLMHCVAGLERPSEGRVWLGEIRLSGLDDEALVRLRRVRLGFVFQSYNLMPMLTVAENIMLPFELAGRAVDHDFADVVVDAMGLRERLMYLPGKLSAAQRQSVAMARALMLKPEVVLADEPTASLEPQQAAQVVRFLRAGVDGLGQSAVVVTHDPVVAAQADRVVFFEQGRIATELRAPTEAEVTERMTALRQRRFSHA
jgi:putative ABC transport system ATP-binding protein